MAEAIGLIASVIQVAGAGLKLSQTLYQYADGVATANRRVKDIAKEIELTSFVIEELGSVFKQDETSNLISKNAVQTANETMKECSTVFAGIDATLKKSKKNTLGRLMLPFRDSKIELLRNHIDKLKSTLQLLMQVLIHAHQVASKRLDREVEAKQREEIKELLENKKKSTKRYEESLRNYSASNGSTIIDDGEESDEESSDSAATDILTMAASAIGSTISPDTLGKCVQHIRALLENIETLQQALTTQTKGDDHSDYHQSLIGSYFRARSHLDGVLFGSSNVLDASNSMTGDHSTIFRAKISEVKVGIQKTTNASTLDHNAPGSRTLTDAEFEKMLRDASEKARADERKNIQQEVMEGQRLKTELSLEKAGNEISTSHTERQAPIKFQDTLMRTYKVPFNICNTWEGMHNFIKHVYDQDTEWKQHVHNVNFDLKDADGSILLPLYWETFIEPGSSITMQFWPRLIKPGSGESSRNTFVESQKPTTPAKKPRNLNHLGNNTTSSLSNIRAHTPSPVAATSMGDHINQHSELGERLDNPQDLTDTLGFMLENINRVTERGERPDSLQDKSDNLSVSAQPSGSSAHVTSDGATGSSSTGRIESSGYPQHMQPMQQWYPYQPQQPPQCAMPPRQFQPQASPVVVSSNPHMTHMPPVNRSMVETKTAPLTEVPSAEASVPPHTPEIQHGVSSVLFEEIGSVRRPRRAHATDGVPEKRFQNERDPRPPTKSTISEMAPESPKLNPPNASQAMRTSTEKSSANIAPAGQTDVLQPHLPPPHHIEDLRSGQDPGSQWGNTISPGDTGPGGNRPATPRLSTSSYGTRSRNRPATASTQLRPQKPSARYMANNGRKTSISRVFDHTKPENDAYRDASDAQTLSMQMTPAVAKAVRLFKRPLTEKMSRSLREKNSLSTGRSKTGTFALLKLAVDFAVESSQSYSHSSSGYAEEDDSTSNDLEVLRHAQLVAETSLDSSLQRRGRAELFGHGAPSRYYYYYSRCDDGKPPLPGSEQNILEEGAAGLRAAPEKTGGADAEVDELLREWTTVLG